jgi:Double zinc ribbon
VTGNAAQACPQCGNPASGNFCAACGAPLGVQPCWSCGAILAAGAKFCHVCGNAVGGEARGDASSAARPLPKPPVAVGTTGGNPTPGTRQPLPWIVAGLLLIVAIAAVVYAVGWHTGIPAPAMAGAGTGGVVAPDISNMTPKEQFNRLIDRVTVAAENADTATVTRFWPMASGAYQNLPPGDRDADARFHMAWLRLFAAQYAPAKALADTIMTDAPNHLFGYYLRASVAQAQGDSVGARAARKAFRAHFDAEMARTDRPEYTQHRAMLEKFRDAAAP